MLILRNGYLEEGCFSYKFVPLICPKGYVVGSWATVWETTRERINDRRSRLLQAFNDQVAEATYLKSLWENVISGLANEAFDKDIPVAMIYADSALREIDLSTRNKTTQIYGRTYHLEGKTGIPAGCNCAPQILTSSDTNNPLYAAFREAQNSHAPVIFSKENGRLPESIFGGEGPSHGNACEDR